MISPGTYKHGITGFCKPGFEPVIKYLDYLGSIGTDKTSQLSVYVKQELVIDVVMCPKGKETTSDTKTVI